MKWSTIVLMLAAAIVLMTIVVGLSMLTLMLADLIPFTRPPWFLWAGYIVAAAVAGVAGLVRLVEGKAR